MIEMTKDTPKLPPAAHLKMSGIYCRPLEMSDAPYFYVWVNDQDLRLYFDRYLVELIQEEEDWIKNLSKRKHQNQVWMICLEDGTRVGSMGLHSIDLKNGTATTGAMFGNKDCHNKGIGEKAKHLILNHAFNVLNLRQIYSCVLSFNLRSIRYSEKCGYKEVARLPNHVKVGDLFFDHVTLMVTRENWLPIWEKFRREHQIESFEEMLARTMKPRIAE